MRGYFRGRWRLIFIAGGLLTVQGCRQAPIRPVVPLPQSPPPVEEPTKAHLLGPWVPTEKNAGDAELTFQTDGSAAFHGGLSYYNPVYWRLDVGAHELFLTFPQAANEKLDIFHMQIGEGVKAFDRKSKQVTYPFDQNTTAINIAGWTYEKPTSTKATAAPEEPTLK